MTVREFINEPDDVKVFWLDDFEELPEESKFLLWHKAKSLPVRSGIALEVEEVEKKSGGKVIALKLEKDIENDKASWDIVMIMVPADDSNP